MGDQVHITTLSGNVLTYTRAEAIDLLRQLQIQLKQRQGELSRQALREAMHLRDELEAVIRPPN